jgi:hypothetical protein
MDRWRRYGKDRLYGEHPGGVKPGWWDLVSDDPHPDSPPAPAPPSRPSSAMGRTLAPVTAVPSGRLAVAGAADVAFALAAPSTPAEDEPESGLPDPFLPAATGGTAEPLTRPWTDLAAHTPGAQAREQARAARAGRTGEDGPGPLPGCAHRRTRLADRS